MSIENGVLVGVDLQPLHWHVPKGRTAGSLPDSRELWEKMWEHRHKVLGFAHSHPGSGIPGPSYTDTTTFEAIEKALGRQIVWWICSRTHVVVCRQFGRSDEWVATPFDGQHLSWLPELRRLSYGTPPYEGYKEYDPWLQASLAGVIAAAREDLENGKAVAQVLVLDAPSLEAGEEFSRLSAVILAQMGLPLKAMG